MEWNDQIIDDALRQSAASLGQSYPHDLPPSGDIWNAINTKRKRGKVVRMQMLWRLAASLLLPATFITLWIVSQKGRNIIVSQKTAPIIELPAAENEALEYIKHQCAGNNIVCQSPVFKELQLELNFSTTELYAIDEQIKLFGNDEQLLRARTRIENHQARIVKAMLQIL
jgi:hypothetical protein